MGYILGNKIIEFDFGEIPIIGNLRNGSVVGLSKEGVLLIDLIKKDINFGMEDISEEQLQLLDFLVNKEFVLKQDKYKSNSNEKVKHFSAYLHVTNWCNLSCEGCYSLDNKRNVEDDLTFIEIKKVLDELIKEGLRNLIISGGEPLMRDDLEDILLYAKEQGVEINLITNGTLMTHDRAKRLKDCVNSIAVSIDGFNKKNANFIRSTSKDNFGKVINCIEILKDLGIRTSIIPTIHSKNYQYAKRYTELANKLGIGINFSIFTCDFNEFKFKELKLSDEQLKVVANGAFNEKLNIDDTNINGRSMRVLNKCGAGDNLISIDASGNVYPCHMLHFKELSMGNLKINSIKDIFHNKESKIGLPIVDDVEICAECGYKYLCGGGCRARAYLNSGKLLSKDPYCMLFKDYYELLEVDLNKIYS